MSEYSMRRTRTRRRAAGFTLIELMVAMLLGLIVIGGVTSVFLAGQQTYRTNDALGEVQDASRIAFELLSRDVRSAGYTGCDGSSGRIANVINAPIPWYADWSNTLLGYDDASKDPALSTLPTTGATSPVAATSSVHTLGSTNLDVVVSAVTPSSAANININAASTLLTTGSLIMVCDFDHSTIMQVDSYAAGGTVVTHNSGSAIPPGNCSLGLGYPTSCGTANAYTFLANARMALLSGSVWYLGNNPAGTTSLYRLTAISSATGTTATAQEMVRNVTALKISYLPLGNAAFGTAASVTNWPQVTAVQVQLTLASTNKLAGVDGKPLVRSFTSTTTLRNRVP